MKKSLYQSLTSLHAATAALTRRCFTLAGFTLCSTFIAITQAEADPVNITSKLQLLGSHNDASNLAGVVRHRDRVYMASYRSSSSSQANFYNIGSNQMGNDGEIQLEENEGGKIIYGNYVVTGSDTAGNLGNTNVIYIREYDKFYPIVPPGDAATHRVTQGIFEGKIFGNELHLNNYARSTYPSGIYSEDYGKTWNRGFKLQGKNGFKAQLRDFQGTLRDPIDTSISTYFTFKGNFFAMATLTGIYPLNQFNGLPSQPKEKENFLTRFTRNPAEPWELTYHNHIDMGFRGFTRNFGRNSTLVRAVFTEFKDFLFMGERGLLLRFDSEEVDSLENVGEKYFRPKAGPTEVWNSQYLPGGDERMLVGRANPAMIQRHGILYRIEFRNTSPTDQKRVMVRSTDGINWEDIITVDVGTSESPLSSWKAYLVFGAPETPSHFFDWDVNGDLYIGSSTRKIYRVRAADLGSAAHNGNFNSNPVAKDDSFVCPFGNLDIEKALYGLLVNDSDPDGDAHYSELVTQPSHGTVELRYNGTFSYRPVAGFVGIDTFTYRVTDEFGYSAPATVTLNVTRTSESTRLDELGRITFGDDGSPYGSNQDGSNGRPSSMIVSGDRRAVTISGNVWKKFPLSYTVTTKTVMEFTVSGSDTGEILALALDNDNINTNPGPGNLKRAFLVGGSDADVVGGEDWAAQVIPSYVKNTPARTYLIPVGTYFTGGVVNFGLIGDDDADGSTNITFSNVRLYESGAYEALRATFDWGTTPVADRDANDDANKNGVSNLLEFAFNMSPTAPGGPTMLKPGTGTSGMPAVSVITPETPTLRIEYLRRKNSGLSYKVKFSDDLVTWEDAIANPTPTSINTDWERMIMPDTAGAGRTKRFARVVVSEGN